MSDEDEKCFKDDNKFNEQKPTCQESSPGNSTDSYTDEDIDHINEDPLANLDANVKNKVAVDF